MLTTCAREVARPRPASRTWAHLALCVAAVSLLAVGCGGSSTDPGTSPRILAFIASPASVIQGRTARLAWETEGATSIELADETGARAEVPADRLSGNVESAPLESTRDFVLTARSSGGVATARLTVTVLLDPTEVAITRFEVAPRTIAPGGSATLRWETENARGVTLAEVDGATLEPTAAPRGERVVTDVRTTRSYVVIADGPRGPKSQTVTLLVEGTPVVDSFTADDAQVEPGASTTLRWGVRGAPDGTTVTVLGFDDAVVARAQPTTGSISVSPILNTSYVLRIDTPLGQSVRSAPLLVSVGGFPRVLRFDVSPDTVPFGDAATITWRVENAVGVVVRSPTAELAASPLGEGTVTVTATRTTTFTLVATNPRGDSIRAVTLTVEPAAPRIARFVVDPPIVVLGARTTLRWTVVGGVEQTLRTAAGAPLVRTPDAEGAIEVAITSTRTTYTLEARNPSGTARAVVEVLGTGRSEITRLETSPAFFTGSSTTVDVHFATRSATAARLDVGSRRAALGAGVTSGTYTFTATASTRVVLVALGPRGVARRDAWTRRALLVAEQGDTSTSAVVLVGPNAAAIGALVGADVDWYAVDVPRGGSVRAFTTDALGGCSVDTTLELYAPDGRLLGFDDDDGPGPCSELEPARDAFAAGLAAGRHLLAVRGFGPALRGGYVLVVELGAPGCGNGLVETPSGEQCDDGNRAAGDGCDASCRVEPIGRVHGPGGNGRFTTSTAVGRLEQIVELVLTAPGYVEAETFVPTPGRCDPSGASRDTVLTLYDPNLAVLGRDDDGGLATCSRIDPARARWAALPAGRYLLGVREGGDDEPLAQVTVDVRLLGVGCGNGVVESGEQCDDGNTVGADGCTSSCRLDGVAELEPNDTLATAPRLGGPGVERVQFVGALDPSRSRRRPRPISPWTPAPPSSGSASARTPRCGCSSARRCASWRSSTTPRARAPRSTRAECGSMPAGTW
jgi:cysteine-rich repeat protein